MGIRSHYRHLRSLEMEQGENTKWNTSGFCYLEFVEFVVHSVREGMGRSSHSLLTHLYTDKNMDVV